MLSKLSAASDSVLSVFLDAAIVPDKPEGRADSISPNAAASSGVMMPAETRCAKSSWISVMSASWISSNAEREFLRELRLEDRRPISFFRSSTALRSWSI